MEDRGGGGRDKILLRQFASTYVIEHQQLSKILCNKENEILV